MKFTNVSNHPTNVYADDGVVRVDPGESVTVSSDRQVELANENPRLRADSEAKSESKAPAKKAPARKRSTKRTAKKANTGTVTTDKVATKR